MAHSPHPIRRGVPTTLTLDPDARSLLEAMIKNHKSFGLLLSELIRKEARERAARPALLEALRHQQATPEVAAEADRAVG